MSEPKPGSGNDRYGVRAAPLSWRSDWTLDGWYFYFRKPAMGPAHECRPVTRYDCVTAGSR